MIIPAICECSRLQMAHVGCECGAPEPFSYERYDLICEAEAENAFRDYERRQQDAEDAYWQQQIEIDAAWTYQAG